MSSVLPPFEDPEGSSGCNANRLREARSADEVHLGEKQARSAGVASYKQTSSCNVSISER